jgi:acyl transferase domain-containing protein
VVVGHSSGEIAAAYCTGALSLRSACRIAYFRGCVAASLEVSTHPGAMLAVGLSEMEIQDFINQIDSKHGLITIACLNSPKSVTLSGSRASIDELEDLLEREKVFFRRLPGRVAYHSPQMHEVAQLYKTLIADISSGSPINDRLVMVSSLTGRKISVESTSTANDWVENLTSPVKFAQALSKLGGPLVRKLRESVNGNESIPSVSDFLEIGPHSTLKGAVRDSIIPKTRQKSFSYASMLVRGRSAHDTAAEALGHLWCQGYKVNIALFNDCKSPNQQHNMLTNLPGYPFDHSKKFWLESRISQGFRFREHAPLPVLGTPVPDWSPLEPRWRNIISLADNTWIKDHNVSNV